MKATKLLTLIVATITCTVWGQDTRQTPTNDRSVMDVSCQNDVAGSCHRIRLRAAELALLDLERQLTSSGTASQAQLLMIAATRSKVALAGLQAERSTDGTFSLRCTESAATLVPPIL